MRAIVLTAFVLAGLIAAPDAQGEEKTKYPQHTMKRGDLILTIYLPDAEKGYYRGTRFDWSGLVGQATYKGHTFFGPWKATHDPANAEDADAIAEEFGINGPPSFSEAKAGEQFIKIGVGVLERPDTKPYNFMHPYKIVTPGKWEIAHYEGAIEFIQNLEGPRDWAYQYVKRLSLNPRGDGFTVSHQLKNTGKKTIETQHYCHNFVIFDEQPVGPGYQLIFPFAAKAKRPMESAKIDGTVIEFSRELKEKEALFTELEGNRKRDEENHVVVKHTKCGIAVTIGGDAALDHFNFFAVRRSVCPEPFINVNLAPGKSMKWKTTYLFAVEIK
jgi:hypothetical protein